MAREVRMVIGLSLIAVGVVILVASYFATEIASSVSYAFGFYDLSDLPPEEKISTSLKRVISSVSPESEINVVIELTGNDVVAKAQQRYVAEKFSELYGFVPDYYFTIINAVSGYVKAKYVLDIAKDPNVKSVYYADALVATIEEDDGIFTFEMLSQSVPMIGAHKAWSKGYTGQGVTVFVIDTGIDNDHPALMRGEKSLVIEEYNLIPDANDYSYTHGTKVAGVIASQNSKYKGVAPGIKGFVDIIALTKIGGTYVRLLKAYDYVYINAERFSPAVCTNSYAYREYYDSPEINKLRRTALKLATKVPMVFAAGNNGPGRGTVYGIGDADGYVNGKFYDLITVGAIDKSRNVAEFSARGPDKWGIDHNEPDLVAPGVEIKTTYPGGNYFLPASGTSFATPHVTGTIALMLSKNPYLDHIQVFEILTKTAEDLGKAGFDYDYGYGMVRADLAVDATPNPPPASALLTIVKINPMVVVSTFMIAVGSFMVISRYV